MSAESKDERIADIFQRCLENDEDWLEMQTALEDSDTGEVLSGIREYASKNNLDDSDLRYAGFIAISNLMRVMKDVINEDFDYFDEAISSNHDI